MPDHLDVAILGGGPAGEAVVRRLSSEGLNVALIEQELVGGECVYWACVPSKTLLRPAEVRTEAKRVKGLAQPQLRWDRIAEYRDFMISGLVDTEKATKMESAGATVLRGVETGQMLRGLGTEVAVVQEADRLLPREAAELGKELARRFAEDGIQLQLNPDVARVGNARERTELVLEDGCRLEAERLVVAVGRRPRVQDLGFRIGRDPSWQGWRHRRRWTLQSCRECVGRG